MKNRALLTLRDTWKAFKTGVSISAYSIYEVGLPNNINLAQLFTNTNFSGLSQYTYPQILAKYPYFEEKNGNWVQVKHMSDIVDSLFATYSESYCCFYDYENNATDAEKEAIKDDRVKKFYSTLFSILDDTWDKYDNILSIYEAKKSHLLDAVKTTSFGDNSRTIEGESTGTRSNTSSGTTSGTNTTTYNTSDVDTKTDEHTGSDTHTTTHNTSTAYTSNEETTGTDTNEVAYNSQVANTRNVDTQVDAVNKVKDTPQTSIAPDSDGYNSQVGSNSTTTDEDSTSTDTRSGEDTTTTTYGKVFDKTDSTINTGTDTLQDTYNSTIDSYDTHKKTGTEQVASSGTTSGTDSESTSGTNNTTESGDFTNTTSDERDTLMARINEIDNLYKMVVREWAKEFKALFWEVVEYEE